MLLDDLVFVREFEEACQSVFQTVPFLPRCLQKLMKVMLDTRDGSHTYHRKYNSPESTWLIARPAK